MSDDLRDSDIPTDADKPAKPEPDPYAYWDDVRRPAQDLNRGLITGMGQPGSGALGTDWGQMLEDVVVLAGMLIVFVAKAVAWPFRWAWKRTRGETLS